MDEHTMEYYSAMKRNEVLMHSTAQMHLKNITLCERSQTQRPHGVRFHLCETPRRGKSIDRKEVGVPFQVKMFENCDGYTTLNVLETIELYTVTLNMGWNCVSTHTRIFFRK